MTETKTMDEAIRRISETRDSLLFGELAEDMDDHLFAAPHFLSALALLEQAEQEMKLADLFRTRSIAGTF